MPSDMSLIKSIEDSVDPSDYISDGMNLWPLYRFFIAEKLREKNIFLCNREPVSSKKGK